MNKDNITERTPVLFLQPDFLPVLISGEKKEQNGEDSYFCALENQSAFIGVFDGSGGSGARTYPEFGGKTGAYIAARAAAEGAFSWFRQWTEAGTDVPLTTESLMQEINASLGIWHEATESRSLLKSSLTREFPTTFAGQVIMPDEDEQKLKVCFLWCGDSRCYVLDRSGLHQVSVDDLAVTDALRNLSEDAPMRNVISASNPYTINERRLKIRKPCVLLTATDGCFGYMKSPMEFERLLLETLSGAKCADEWRTALEGAFRRIAGDDFTLCMLPFGFGTFDNLRSFFAERLQLLMEKYFSPESEDPEEIRTRWEIYRKEYERYQ